MDKHHKAGNNDRELELAIQNSNEADKAFLYVIMFTSLSKSFIIKELRTSSCHYELITMSIKERVR